MVALNGQEVVSAIAMKLREGLPKERIGEIYKDKPVQSFRPPCIFIHSVETSHTPQMNNFAKWDYIIDIRCHPPKMRTDVHTWARDLGVDILDIVDNIYVDGQRVKAQNISQKVEDGVLHIVVTYGFRVLKTKDPVPDMQTLVYGERVKD